MISGIILVANKNDLYYDLPTKRVLIVFLTYISMHITIIIHFLKEDFLKKFTRISRLIKALEII